MGRMDKGERQSVDGRHSVQFIGMFDNKNGPVVRLRWTDRDLVASAAD